MKKCILDSCVSIGKKCSDCQHQIGKIKPKNENIKKTNKKTNEIDDVINSLED